MKKKWLTAAVIFLSGAIVFLCALNGARLFYPFSFKSEISSAAEEFGLEKSLVASIIYSESKFDKDAVSSKGALGLMQIMPSTARSFYTGEDFDESILFEPSENIKIGSAYLSYLFSKYGDEVTVIACYNAGETAVRGWMKEGKLNEEDIKYGETKAYIKKVLKMKKYYNIYF